MSQPPRVRPVEQQRPRASRWTTEEAEVSEPVPAETRAGRAIDALVQATPLLRERLHAAMRDTQAVAAYPSIQPIHADAPAQHAAAKDATGNPSRSGTKTSTGAGRQTDASADALANSAKRPLATASTRTPSADADRPPVDAESEGNAPFDRTHSRRDADPARGGLTVPPGAGRNSSQKARGTIDPLRYPAQHPYRDEAATDLRRMPVPPVDRVTQDQRVWGPGRRWRGRGPAATLAVLTGAIAAIVLTSVFWKTAAKAAPEGEADGNTAEQRKDARTGTR